MKQSLQLKLSQHLALTPQLQQSIRLLQLSTLELNQEIEQALQENPLLERDEPIDGAQFVPSADAMAVSQPAPESEPVREFDDNAADAGWGTEFPAGHAPRDGGDDDVDAADIQAAATGLREHLTAQLALTQLSRRERALVAYLVEALDDDGYLTQSIDELTDSIAADDDASREEIAEEVAIALRHLQHFDPPGIGARSPQECLGIQLHYLAPSPTRDLAQAIVAHHLDHFAARDFARIKKALGCDDEQLRAAQALIRSLNPRPGAQFAPLDTRYVIPDVVVRKVRGAWRVSLNGEAMPKLRINRLYADILQSQRGSRGSAASLAGQLQEAKWLIKNVQQRFDTIQRVAQAIVDRQKAFFDHGEVAMRPLTLREIADGVRTQVFFRQPRRHRYRRSCLVDCDPCAYQAAGGCRGWPQAALGRPDRGHSWRAGHRGGAAYRRQVPRVPEHPAGQSQKEHLTPVAPINHRAS
jgi:RNA polymerase sigma-54 factor